MNARAQRRVLSSRKRAARRMLKPRSGAWDEAMDMMRTTLGLAASVLLFHACGGDFSESRIEKSFDSDGAPVIDVHTFNGAICVTTRTDPEVRIRAIKRVHSGQEDLFNNVVVSMDQQDNAISVRASLDSSGDDDAWAGVEIDLEVPHGAILDLSTDNDHICTNGVHGGLKARTTNGEITVKDAKGPVDVKTTNGGVEIESSTALINAGTTNGSIDVVGPLTSGEHSFDTTNGSITIRLPRGAEFTVDATTTNGSISSDFHLTDVTKVGETQLAGTEGTGGDTSLTVTTTNGSITLKQDG